MEPGHVSTEVRVLAHTRVNSEVAWGRLARSLFVSIFDSASSIHYCIIVSSVNIVEGLVSLHKLSRAWRLLTRAVGATSDRLSLGNSCVVQLSWLLPVEGSIILHKRPRAGWNRPLAGRLCHSSGLASLGELVQATARRKRLVSIWVRVSRLLYKLEQCN